MSGADDGDGYAAKIDLLVGGEVVERLLLEPGDSYEAEVHTDDFEIRVPEGGGR